ncbi:putative Neurogenic locus notch like protein 2 [Venustampulla echinocandica]|uniref:Putative Neurogenic locus notch like protein 2 n=1 Tax=Venustampulla echinocandica TaxID=2656787 RepID=A0A370TZP7_9HELO|nr:putative Neurogenic locus notch like protein 2 [Venustampulla echinocandica]RDL41002.1 putative Neurogenic locus notch like protein 2 [Venustampulla echinocandica]
MAASMDIDKPGKYPIVLSDALLGKTSKEVYTGIRYNHKPDPTSDSSPSSMHLEPSESDPASYDLSFADNSDKYSYHGARASADGQYVLIFDPLKKHFVLHRVDSTFNMNLVSAPWAEDESMLRSQYQQLETPRAKAAATAQPPRRKPSKAAKSAPVAVTKNDPAKRKKVEKATKPKPPPREPTPEEEESDDGLTIEYPDGGPSSQQYQYKSTPVVQREASEEVSEEDSDADGEEYEAERNQDVDHLKLPSPANNGGGLSDEDIELDLEAELEQALKETEGHGADESSSESEEE